MLTAKGQIQDKVRGFDIGADDYLPKPYDKAEFEARVKALLKRSASPPYATEQGDCTFIISCKPEHRTNIRVAGTVGLSTMTKGVLDIDADAYARQGDNVPKFDWRFNSKQWGSHLYQAIFVNHPEVLSAYNHVLGEVKNDEKLSLRIESARDVLRVPFEFLFEGIPSEGDYLVLRHPLARSITGVRVNRMPLCPGLLNEIWAKGERLYILLIASNTRPPIHGVDQEITALDGTLKDMFEDKGIEVCVKTLTTEEATYENVRRELIRCKYHIVHYAGHGTYDKSSPEESHLSLWEERNCQGRIKRMSAAELQLLLRGSNLRFFYLSCCQGAKTGESIKLLDDDFLGLADGISHAGVPSVLGFRWPVSDSGAKTLALSFYESVAKQGRIDTALLNARCEVAERDRDDITWLSPVLIMQA